MFTFTLQLIAFKDGNNSKCGLKKLHLKEI